MAAFGAYSSSRVIGTNWANPSIHMRGAFEAWHGIHAPKKLFIGPPDFITHYPITKSDTVGKPLHSAYNQLSSSEK